MQRLPIAEVNASNKGTARASLRGASFSPDGRTLAIDIGNGLVHVIETATGKIRHTYGKLREVKLPGIPPDQRNAPLFYGSNWHGETGQLTVAFSSDGRLLAYAGLENVLLLFDTRTGENLGQYAGHSGEIGPIAFSPNGRNLATASADTTALIWDVAKLNSKSMRVPQTLDAAAIEKRWKLLAGDDAKAACVGMHDLAASPKETVAFLKAQMKFDSKFQSEAIEKLIQQLDSTEFNSRQKAQQQLQILGDQALRHVEKALTRKVSLETRQRLEGAHANLTGPVSGSPLQVLRAIELLEQIDTKEAHELLRYASQQSPSPRTGEAAKAALRRLGN